jgi:hypothetical protein
VLPRITIENLLDTYFSFPDDIRKISPSLHIALSVVNYFLGEDWLEKHLNPLVLKSGFLRLRLDPANETYIQTYKTIDLAELLFNLQHVVGFDECVTRMKTEQHVESGLAELDFGRMLRINNQKFRFITPKGARGDDYDFEITLGKWVVCADVKCKLEDKHISKSIVMNELKGSRNQLPDDKPGMFFIKVPQHWMQKYLYDQLLVETAKEFLRSTRRIVAIKYYIAPYGVQGDKLAQGHYFKEVSNPNNRFDRNRTWELFPYRPPPGAPNAMPPNWVRLSDFPHTALRNQPPSPL